MLSHVQPRAACGRRARQRRRQRSRSARIQRARQPVCGESSRGLTCGLAATQCSRSHQVELPQKNPQPLNSYMQEWCEHTPVNNCTIRLNKHSGNYFSVTTKFLSLLLWLFSLSLVVSSRASNGLRRREACGDCSAAGAGLHVQRSRRQSLHVRRQVRASPPRTRSRGGLCVGRRALRALPRAQHDMLMKCHVVLCYCASPAPTTTTRCSS